MRAIQLLQQPDARRRLLVYLPFLDFGAAWLSALAAAVFEVLLVLLLASVLLAAVAAFGLVC